MAKESSHAVWLRKGQETADRLRESVGVSVDPERVRKTLEAALEALQKQAKALRDVKYEDAVVCPGCKMVVRAAPVAKEIGQTAAYTAKVVDEIYRLSEFAQGRADSRPDVGVGDLLQFISDEQLQVLMGWVQEAKARNVLSLASIPKTLQ